jgi:hypothetical protein
MPFCPFAGTVVIFARFTFADCLVPTSKLDVSSRPHTVFVSPRLSFWSSAIHPALSENDSSRRYCNTLHTAAYAGASPDSRSQHTADSTLCPFCCFHRLGDALPSSEAAPSSPRSPRRPPVRPGMKLTVPNISQTAHGTGPSVLAAGLGLPCHMDRQAASMILDSLAPRSSIGLACVGKGQGASRRRAAVAAK